MASSQSPSYFATIHGGNIPTTAPGSASSSDPAATTSLESAVPPLPLTNDPSHNHDDDADGDGHDHDHDYHDDTEHAHQDHDHHATNTNTTTTTSNSLANSTPHLQSRLSSLRAQSHALSTELTKKLATSRSGQSLLHIGPSLSTLPPDLALLSESLAPLLKEVEDYEKCNRDELERLVALGRRVQLGVVRGGVARECVEMYGDLVGAEEVLRRDVDWRIRRGKGGGDGVGVGVSGEEKRGEREGGYLLSDTDSDSDMESEDELEESDTELDHVTSLERAAYTTLYLLQELQTSSAQVSALTAASSTSDDHANNSLPSLFGGPAAASNSASGLGGVIIEKSRFLMKLSPRIRRLESDTVKCLVGRLEELLVEMRSVMERQFHDDRVPSDEDDDGIGRGGVHPAKERERQARKRRKENLLLMIGHCLRGLALLGKGADAESAFARVAIMPIIRSKLSMGKLDEGGSRGECAGLFFLLDDIANTVASMYGSILRVSEGMFAPAERDVRVEHGDGNDNEHENDNTAKGCNNPMEVDLVTCGVWVPVATALMADPGIKMAIFSPGIANVLQANYSALDTFLSELASSLLNNVKPSDDDHKSSITSALVADIGDFSHLYYQPTLTTQSIENAQSRIYRHPTTVEFSKKWNLPIYYQLRFAEFCKRLDRALDGVRREGWEANVFTGEVRDAKAIQDQLGFELPIFLELYDTLLSMWKSNVFLRPLTHRFLRGAVQLVGRVLGFVKEGLDGNIEFGENNGNENDASSGTMVGLPPYFWHERVEDVAMVTWELTILDTCMTHDYLEVIANTVCPTDKESRQSTHNSSIELDEIRALASNVLIESSHEISPVVSHSWNALIVDNLTSQCSVPLSAVKGVAATYRMTNRPPPTQASPFVATILRPLKDFDSSYSSRTPPQIGDDWKYQIIGTVSTKYSVAVEELIATVKRTEEALKSRKTRRMMAGGMSDGEKVKLQLYLDHREFRSQVEELGVDAESVEGLVKLGELTQEAENLFLQSQSN